MGAHWPAPQRLVPPRLLQAIRVADAGRAAEALALLDTEDVQDPFTHDAARLVRGLVATEQGADANARRTLRGLLHAEDPALVLLATTALVELHVRARRYSSAVPLIARAQRVCSAEPETALFLDTLAARLHLLRKGQAAAARVETLPPRLQRQHPAAVHAAVHLVSAEAALADGRLQSAVAAARAARPFVEAAASSVLRRQLASLAALLDEAPFADAEDWQRPLRPVSRSQVADLESAPWERWLDSLHRQIRLRASGAEAVVTFGSAPELWNALALVARAPRQRLRWEQAARAMQQRESRARSRVESLADHLGEHAGLLGLDDAGYSLRPARFVHLYLTRETPDTQQRILASLAEHGVQRAGELAARLPCARRTLLRHLGVLRRSGLVRLVGGGRDASYALV